MKTLFWNVQVSINNRYPFRIVAYFNLEVISSIMWIAKQESGRTSIEMTI